MSRQYQPPAEEYAGQRTAWSLVRRPPLEHEHSGLSHTDASHLGTRLCRAAAEIGCWRYLPEHLIELRRCLEKPHD